MKVLHFYIMLMLVYVFCHARIPKQKKIPILNPDEDFAFLHDVNYVDITFLYEVSSNVHTLLCEYCEIAKDYNLEYQTLKRAMYFLSDVNSSVCTLLCDYCEATENYIPKPQTPMKVLDFCLMSVLMYLFYWAGIARQQKITILNLEP
jgi:hypothetical protein